MLHDPIPSEKYQAPQRRGSLVKRWLMVARCRENSVSPRRVGLGNGSLNKCLIQSNMQFTHSNTDSLISPLFHCFIVSLLHAIMYSFLHSCLHSFIDSLILSFIPSFIHSFIPFHFISHHFISIQFIHSLTHLSLTQ